MNAPVEIVETLNLVYLATKQVTTHLYNISHIALLENDSDGAQAIVERSKCFDYG